MVGKKVWTDKVCEKPTSEAEKYFYRIDHGDQKNVWFYQNDIQLRKYPMEIIRVDNVPKDSKGRELEKFLTPKWGHLSETWITSHFKSKFEGPTAEAMVFREPYPYGTEIYPLNNVKRTVTQTYFPSKGENTFPASKE